MKTGFEKASLVSIRFIMFYALTVVASAAFLCCSSSGDKDGKAADQAVKKKTQEQVILKMAFSAIKRKSIGNFMGITITPADYAILEMGITEQQAQQTHVGSSVRPHQREELREQFDMAVAGGEGMIDFANSEFVGPGTLIESGRRSTVNGAQYFSEEYSIRIKINGEVIDTKDLSPTFVISYWQTQFRIIELKFTEPDYY